MLTPDCIIAYLKSPLDNGDKQCSDTLSPPIEFPNMVTWSGSPPNLKCNKKHLVQLFIWINSTGSKWFRNKWCLSIRIWKKLLKEIHVVVYMLKKWKKLSEQICTQKTWSVISFLIRILSLNILGYPGDIICRSTFQAKAKPMCECIVLIYFKGLFVSHCLCFKTKHKLKIAHELEMWLRKGY